MSSSNDRVIYSTEHVLTSLCNSVTRVLTVATLLEPRIRSVKCVLVSIRFMTPCGSQSMSMALPV